MIPKILHFIWIGNHIPLYAMFSIQSFKKINKTFSIHFLHYTIEQIENIDVKNDDDYLLQKAINGILCKCNKYLNIIQHCKCNKLLFIQLLSDIYRLEILNFYGGIYLDCDCFPKRPFDDEILSYEQFIVQRHFSNNSLENDNYFIGTQNGKKLWDIFDKSCIKNTKKIIQTERNWYNNIKYLKLKKKFIDCKLQIGETFSTKDFYIDHYSLKTWKDCGKGIQTPICKYDNCNIYL